MTGDDERMPSLHVRVLVTEDGEEGHPMDVTLTTVDVDEHGDPTSASLATVDHRVRREVRRVLAKRRTAGPS